MIITKWLNTKITTTVTIGLKFELLDNLDVFIFYFWHKLKYSLALQRLDSSLLLKFSKDVLKKATRINTLILLFKHEFQIVNFK